MCCVFTADHEDKWWEMYKDNVLEAYDDGQDIIIVSRRSYENRVEETDIDVAAGGDEFLSRTTKQPWPPSGYSRKKGDHISEYGNAQMVEVSWIREMVERFTGISRVQGQRAIDPRRVHYKRVEELDELRAVLPDGARYDGEWSVSGKMHGYGKCAWVDGIVYEGQWENGLQNGQGTLTHPDGQTQSGAWENGVFNPAQPAQRRPLMLHGKNMPAASPHPVGRSRRGS